MEMVFGRVRNCHAATVRAVLTTRVVLRERVGKPSSSSSQVGKSDHLISWNPLTISGRIFLRIVLYRVSCLYMQGTSPIDR